MNWKYNETEHRYDLLDASGETFCWLRKRAGALMWTVHAPSLESGLFIVHASNEDEAIWRATLLIYNECNMRANFFHKIRDSLPDIRRLAENACVI